MGEHRFSEVRVERAAQSIAVHDKVLEINLPSRTQIELELGMQHFVHEPALALPY